MRRTLAVAFCLVLGLAAEAQANQENWFLFGPGGPFARAGQAPQVQRVAPVVQPAQRQLRRALPSPRVAHVGPQHAAGAAARARVNPAARAPASREAAFVEPRLRRQLVDYKGKHAPGTIIVDTRARYLYHVEKGGKATRYGVGVGRAGFEWSGTARIGRKAKWPGWTPPPEMRKRQPGLPVHMAGGPDNPLGARALYLYRGGKDTLYRIHGTNDPRSIGLALSSGCIRMMNEDVEHLYSRAKIGTKVVVM
jgi:lipoprotein-anchoring transpeptidase ErfK/SrfK